MRRLMIATALAAFVSPAVLHAESPPLGQLPSGVSPVRYQLDLDIEPEADRFAGIATIELDIEKATDTIWLHGQDLSVNAAYVTSPEGDRIDALYEQIGDTGAVRLDLDADIGPGPATLTVDYDAELRSDLVGLYKVGDGQQTYAYTDFQPLDARRAFPGFDEPRFKTPFDITVTTDADNAVISNAKARETSILADGRKRVAFQSTVPLPTYLVALAIGDFDVVDARPIPPSASRPHAIELRGVAPKGRGDRLTYALENTAEMVEILETYFEVPFPYDKLDLVAPAEFGPAGMENAGAIFYRPDRLLLPDAPSVYQQRGFAYLHAHELAHSWFGNLVTPKWWDDIWLNEAFATWMAAKTVHSWRPETFDDRNLQRGVGRPMWNDRLASARQIRQPIALDSEVSGAFDVITYSKGGGVLSMIERYLGPETFRTGVQSFIRRHADGVATSEDFFSALSEAADNPAIDRALRTFVDQVGIPRVDLDWTCDTAGTTRVSLRQSRSLPLGSKATRDTLWSIPLCLVYPEGSSRARQCLLLETERMTVALPTRQCPAWILPNEAGAGYFHFTVPAAGWDALIAAFDTLHPAEALATVRSAYAAFEAGTIDTTRLLAILETTSRSPHWDVAGAAKQPLRNLKNFYIPRSNREAILAETRRLFRPALDRLDLSDPILSGRDLDSDQALLRNDLIWFMAIDSEDPDLRARLTQLAKTYIGYETGGTIDETAVDPDLVRAALFAAAGSGDQALVDALIELFRTTDDRRLRDNLLRAITNNTDRASVAKVHALILDPEIPGYMASELLRGLARRVDNRDANFAFMQANYDALLDRFPVSHHAWMPWRASAFCDTESRMEVEAFFADKVAGNAGGERSLANVLEAIGICAAIAEKQRDGALLALDHVD